MTPCFLQEHILSLFSADVYLFRNIASNSHALIVSGTLCDTGITTKATGSETDLIVQKKIIAHGW